MVREMCGSVDEIKKAMSRVAEQQHRHNWRDTNQLQCLVMASIASLGVNS
jgi:hypothetical protein